MWHIRADLFKTIVNFTKYGDGVTRIYLGLQQYCLLSKGRTAEVSTPCGLCVVQV
jgi:hypothetical protein